VCVHARRWLLFAKHLQHTAAGVFFVQKQGVALQARIQADLLVFAVVCTPFVVCRSRFLALRWA
jgi:hypothetical protein